MVDILALALLLSAFGATVHHILATQMGGDTGIAPFGGSVSANRLRQVNAKADEEVDGPTWASFPRAL